MTEKLKHNNFFIFADEIRDQILEDYTDQEIGQLFRALLDYAIDGVEPTFTDRGLRTFWRTLKGQIDRQRQHTEEKSDKNKNNQYDRWLRHWINNDEGQRLTQFLEEHPEFDLEDWLARHPIDIYHTNVYARIQAYRFVYEYDSRIPSIPNLTFPDQEKKHLSKDRCKNIQTRRADFDVYVYETYRGTYPLEMLAKFCRKWTESNIDGNKMLFEVTKNFNVEKSLENWDDNSFRFDK